MKNESTTTHVLGFDEVGRGSLAGPVVVGCVYSCTKATVSPPNLVIRDSKTMTRKQRDISASWIREHVLFSLGAVEAYEIDLLGIEKATRLAAKRCLQNYTLKYGPVTEAKVIVDGCREWFSGCEPIVRADSLIPEVSMAAIVAKVFRDRWMGVLGEIYPEWGFERHVGYGTHHHRKKIQTCGLLPGVHRRSFCKHYFR